MPQFDGRSIEALEKVAQRQWDSMENLATVLRHVHHAAGKPGIDKERLRRLSLRIKRRLRDHTAGQPG